MANHRKVNTKPNRFSTAAACAFLALVLLLLSVVSGVYAKYVWGMERKSAVSAPNFYFTSDLLAENPKTYTLNPGAGGTTSFTFEVRNYADELRNTDMNVAYSIMVTPSDGVKVTPASGKLTASQKSTAAITVSGLKNGQTYTITATGRAGFESTLSANVTVRPDAQNIYKHLYVDSTDPNYVLLTVWTENVSGEVSITFPAELIPDNTDAAMAGTFTPSGDGDGAAYMFTDNSNFTASYSSHVYRFFKVSNISYDVSDFTVKIGKKLATPGVPK